MTPETQPPVEPLITPASEPQSEPRTSSTATEVLAAAAAAAEPSAKRQKTEHRATPLITTPTMSVPCHHVLETISLEHVPETYSVHVAVFRDVENAAFLHHQLLSRNADYEYAFIDAGVITSRLQVLSAVFKAITLQVAGTLKTPNIHSEIVCSLSPTNNISESYRRYGMTPTSRDIVVVKVIEAKSEEEEAGKRNTTSAQTIEEHLLANVRGQPAPFTDETLAQLTDPARVRKYYKLNGVGWLDGLQDQAAKKGEMDALIVGGIALRGL
ncbi:kinase binding protein CGI-121-domain-containing protein [Xylariaceae sp. FL0594]|nr:kinase binding protein CGI-121-domain-containing protein [Xylariaceae sp. FL0594]